MEKTCPFCVPEPSRLLVSEGLVLALRDGYPVSRGHSLIVPRRHVGSFGEVSLEEQSAMLAMLQRVRALLDAELRPEKADYWSGRRKRGQGEFSGSTCHGVYVAAEN
jgi:diadenosine tetraphosphate (Ap4A) HIT family hydrolase